MAVNIRIKEKSVAGDALHIWQQKHKTSVRQAEGPLDPSQAKSSSSAVSLLSKASLCIILLKHGRLCQTMGPHLPKIHEVLLQRPPIAAKVNDGASLHDEGFVKQQKCVGRGTVDGGADGDVVLHLPAQLVCQA